MGISFADTDLPIDDEIISALDASFDSLASAGSWLTGEQRVAVATEARLAKDGSRSSAGPLTDVIKDLVARMVHDSSGFDSDFASQIIEESGDGAYVETAGIVARLSALDYFCAAIGVERRPLPEAQSGEPDRQRPATSEALGAYVDQLSTSSFGEVFGEQYSEIPNIMRALSLVPSEVGPTMKMGAGLYTSDVMNQVDRRGLSKTQIELVAARTSYLNECFY